MHLLLIVICLLVTNTPILAITTPILPVINGTIQQDTTPPVRLEDIPIEPEPVSEEEHNNDGYYFYPSFPSTMPRFPGCEQLEGTAQEKKNCADKLLVQYIYSNINYPEEAKEAGVEGIAVVSFVVDKQGKLKDIKLLRDSGAGIGIEALRVVESMNDLPNPWVPGTYKGKAVDVRFNLPIRFKLTSEEKDIEEENTSIMQ